MINVKNLPSFVDLLKLNMKLKVTNGVKTHAELEMDTKKMMMVTVERNVSVMLEDNMMKIVRIVD